MRIAGIMEETSGREPYSGNAVARRMPNAEIERCTYLHSRRCMKPLKAR